MRKRKCKEISQMVSKTKMMNTENEERFKREKRIARKSKYLEKLYNNAVRLNKTVNLIYYNHFFFPKLYGGPYIRLKCRAEKFFS